MKAGREDGKFSVGDIQAKMVSIADASGQQCYQGVTMLAWADILYMIYRFSYVSVVFINRSADLMTSLQLTISLF